MFKTATPIALVLLAGLASAAVAGPVGPAGPVAPTKLRFEVSFPAAPGAKPLDGHLILLVSKQEQPEPRFLLNEAEARSQQAFGLDVDALAPGAAAVIDDKALGYPIVSLAQVPAGEYYVQAVLNVYETFKRSDGHTVKLPPDRGEGQQWNRKPGNLYSKPQKLQVSPASGGVIKISMTETIPPIEPPKDTKYVKHFTLQSTLLTEFWGRPVFLGAIVVLPAGFEEHPDARYPLLVRHGHFSADFTFRTEPPPPGQRGRGEYSYKLFQDWTSGRLPKVLLLEIQHANPFYDDSYAVDSANVGPYGAAITQELIPEVERRFRGIGQPWARVLEGGSTGGWEALAQQVFYPDLFNGAWAFCPDPIDFRAYQAVNIYEDKNAFWNEGPFGKVPRPEMREEHGMLLATMEPAVRREEVMGTKGRSTDQLGIWQAVFSPVGADGYPKPIWNPTTGVIDMDVAKYWKEHYDLSAIMQRDWTTLGPKLAGKVHLTVGEGDNWFLNNAVHLFQDFADSPKNPYRVADFEYGDRKPHCYSGGGNGPMAESSGTSLQRTLPQMERWMIATAPPQADMSWRY